MQPEVTTNAKIVPHLKASLAARGVVATNPNMEKWAAMARPPANALKTIKGGRLQGMTDVNPQWRYQAMTEQFGQCGVGWKYDIDKMWTEAGTDGEVLAFALVSLRTRTEDGEWSDPVFGVGGNHMIVKESKGLRNNDECWKMAITDGLSVALKMLGVAADIYAGLWDGSKYVAAPVQASRQAPVVVQAPQRIALPEGTVQILSVAVTAWGGDVKVVGPDGVEVDHKTTERRCAELCESLAQEGVPVKLTLEPIKTGKNAGKVKLVGVIASRGEPTNADLDAEIAAKEGETLGAF